MGRELENFIAAHGVAVHVGHKAGHDLATEQQQIEEFRKFLEH